MRHEQDPNHANDAMKTGFLREHWRAISAATRLLDLGLIGAAGLLAYALQTGFAPLLPDAAHVAVILGGVILGGLALAATGVYDSWRGAHLLRLLRRILFAWVLAFGVLLVLLVAFEATTGIARGWLATWFFAALAALCGLRVVGYGVMRSLRARGFNTRRVVIYGAGGVGRQAARNVSEAGWTGLQIHAFCDDDRALAATEVDGIPVHEGLTGLEQVVTDARIDEVWLALPLAAEERLEQILDRLRATSVKVRLLPGYFGLRLVSDPVTDIAGMTVINVAEPPIAGVDRFVKAAEDRVIAALMLIALTPVLAGAALAIRVTMGGPVIFSQYRCGWDGAPIRVHKFRTMRHRAPPGELPWQTRPDDPRVTPLGRFLRQTSIDELPQLWNVLRGDMSIVGPRPHALEHDAYYRRRIDQYMKRHRVKPGITGWAQINGYRGETRTVEEMAARVDHDLYYIENWSLGLDLRIILLTPLRMLRDPNAY